MKKITQTLFYLCVFLCASFSITHAQNCNLFFSEYLEGASNNKAIEVYNPTQNSVNLADYKIYRFNNGSPTPTDSLQMVGTLASHSVYVAGNPSAVAAILSVSDTLHTITFFNGDDAMMLMNVTTGDTLDIIGIIGVDPGTNWPVGSGATSEFTLVRMISIAHGTTNWAQSVTEWDVHPQNTTTFLGNHTSNGCCSPTYSTISPTVCDSLIAPSGTIYFTSGVYKDTIVNNAGCDSIITINLTVNYSSSVLINPYICFGASYTLPGGGIVSTAGLYIDTLMSNWGCDSIIMVNLQIRPLSDTLINISVCDSFPWMGAILTNSGTYIDTLTDGNGCDSIITLNLTITIIDTAVTVSGATLSSNQNGATYQWIDCNNNNAPIAGATNQSYVATANGDYAVIVSLNGCTDTSACKKVLSIGLSDQGNTTILIYPNPVQSTLYVQHNTIIKTIILTDITGREIAVESEKTNSNMTILNISSLSKGVYYIKFIEPNNSFTIHKVIKD